MVGLSRCNRAWIAMMVLLAGAQASAAVMTRVDRADIELNESFTLEVISDENIDAQPDISVLEVIEAIDGPLGSDVPLADGLDTESQQRLQMALRQVTLTARRQLESIKLSQIVSTAAATTSEAI